METMERQEHRTRRSFTPEFKFEIAERCHAYDRSISQPSRAAVNPGGPIPASPLCTSVFADPS